MGPVQHRLPTKKLMIKPFYQKNRIATEMATSAEFDTLELRNRDVTEIYSPVEDLGQDRKEGDENKENEDEGTQEESEEEEEEEDDAEDEEEESVSEDDDQEKYDTLHLRKRVVTEIYSPVEDLGQNPPHRQPKYDTLDLRNREVTETLSPMA